MASYSAVGKEDREQGESQAMASACLRPRAVELRSRLLGTMRPREISGATVVGECRLQHSMHPSRLALVTPTVASPVACNCDTFLDFAGSAKLAGSLGSQSTVFQQQCSCASWANKLGTVEVEPPLGIEPRTFSLQD